MRTQIANIEYWVDVPKLFWQVNMIGNPRKQCNQLKLQTNTLIDVKASAVIKYTNLEHGQLKHQIIFQ